MNLGIVAHIVFWILLVLGARERGLRFGLVFVGLWLAGYFVTQSSMTGAFLFGSWVAVLDIALVLIVLKGDLRFP